MNTRDISTINLVSDWGQKFNSDVFCEVVSKEDVSGWLDVGRIYSLVYEGKEICKAKVLSLQPSSQKEVLIQHLPSMLMQLATKDYTKRMHLLPEEFNFVVFEKITLD